MLQYFLRKVHLKMKIKKKSFYLLWSYGQKKMNVSFQKFISYIIKKIMEATLDYYKIKIIEKIG